MPEVLVALMGFCLRISACALLMVLLWKLSMIFWLTAAFVQQAKVPELWLSQGLYRTPFSPPMWAARVSWAGTRSLPIIRCYWVIVCPEQSIMPRTLWPFWKVGICLSPANPLSLDSSMFFTENLVGFLEIKFMFGPAVWKFPLSGSLQAPTSVVQADELCWVASSFWL